MFCCTRHLEVTTACIYECTWPSWLHLYLWKWSGSSVGFTVCSKSSGSSSDPLQNSSRYVSRVLNCMERRGHLLGSSGLLYVRSSCPLMLNWHLQDWQIYKLQRWYSILWPNIQNIPICTVRVHSPRSCAIHKQVSIEEVYPFNWFVFWERVLHDVILACQCVQQHSLRTHEIIIMPITGIIYCKHWS